MVHLDEFEVAGTEIPLCGQVVVPSHVIAPSKLELTLLDAGSSAAAGRRPCRVSPRGMSLVHTHRA